MFGHISDRFSDLFPRFSNHFFSNQNNFGAVSFCRRATLKIVACGGNS